MRCDGDETKNDNDTHTKCRKGKSILTKRSAAKFVVKKLRCDLSNSTRNDGALALALEAKLLQKLSHPNLISMRYLGDNLGGLDFFIIIERLEIDLAQQLHLWKGDEARLRLSKSFKKTKKTEILLSSFYDRVGIAYQVSTAIAYLHNKSVIFRDLKPQNIGLDKHNNAKIFDFGLSKELCDERKLRSDYNEYDKYIATQCAGTPRYMAPEVYNGIIYGLPVDIYSCSLVLWELMSLDESFSFANSLDDLASQVYQNKRRPKINRNWPKEIKKLLKSGWHHSPSKRPEAMEFSDQLQICLRRRLLPPL